MHFDFYLISIFCPHWTNSARPYTKWPEIGADALSYRLSRCHSLFSGFLEFRFIDCSSLELIASHFNWIWLSSSHSEWVSFILFIFQYNFDFCFKVLFLFLPCRFDIFLGGSNGYDLIYLVAKYLQLSISMWHSCRSMGKYCRFIGHDAVMVNLKDVCCFSFFL